MVSNTGSLPKKVAKSNRMTCNENISSKGPGFISVYLLAARTVFKTQKPLRTKISKIVLCPRKYETDLTITNVSFVSLDE